MGGVQRDGDWHDGAWSQFSTVRSGQTEAVKQAKTFHFTMAARVAVLHGAGLDRGQQG